MLCSTQSMALILMAIGLFGAGGTDATRAKDAASGSQDAAAPEEANGRPDDGLVYESYDPLRLKQNEGRELLPFPTFDAALDEFYAKVGACSACDV